MSRAQLRRSADLFDVQGRTPSSPERTADHEPVQRRAAPAPIQLLRETPRELLSGGDRLRVALDRNGVFDRVLGPDPASEKVQARGPLRDVPGIVHQAAQRGVAGAASPLPHADAIQASFGHHDISGVRAAVGGQATEACGEMGALAYATGSTVAFSGAPDLHTAAHEAAHVVQQRGGVSLKGGVGETGDRYERHADRVADAVVAGASAEVLLDQHGSTPSIQFMGKVQRTGNQNGTETEEQDSEPDGVKLLSTLTASPQQGGRVEVARIYFTDAHAELDPHDLSVLAEVANLSREAGVTKLELHGYASAPGDPGRNLQLSLSRAQAVHAALQNALVSTGAGPEPPWEQTFQAHGVTGGRKDQAGSRVVAIYTTAPTPRREAEEEQRADRNAPETELSLTAGDQADYHILLAKRQAKWDEYRYALAHAYNVEQNAAYHGSRHYELETSVKALKFAHEFIEKAQDGPPTPGLQGLQTVQEMKFAAEFETQADQAHTLTKSLEKELDVLEAAIRNHRAYREQDTSYWVAR